MEKKQRAERHSYSSEEIDFLKKIVKGRSYKEIRRLFNERFGLDLNLNQIEYILKTLNLRTGKPSRFQAGYTGWNDSKAVGTERIEEGLILVKISDKVWKRKHHFIWEKAHGPIPKGNIIIFADGDKFNTHLENLLLVSRSEQVIMNHYGLISSDPELTKASLLVARLKLLVAKRARELKERGVTS